MPKVYYFDGADYSGKTTLINNLEKHYVSNKKTVAVFKEPYGKYRDMLLDPSSNLDYTERRLLFLTSHFAVRKMVMDEFSKGTDYIFIDRCALISDYIYSIAECSERKRESYIRHMSSIKNSYSKNADTHYSNFFKDNANIIILHTSKAEFDRRKESRNPTGDINDVKSDWFKESVWRMYNRLFFSGYSSANASELERLFKSTSPVLSDDNALYKVINIIDGGAKDV